MIEISAAVEVFSFVAIAALAIWVTPSTHDRLVRVGGGTATSVVVMSLVRAGDWFGRFRVVRGASSEPPVTIVDRDGSVHVGRAAASLLLSRIPATFLIAAPVRVIMSRQRRANVAGVA
jgi:hypothetical protein